MSEVNKALIRRVAEEVVQQGRVELVPEFFAPDYIVHDPSNPDRPGGVAGAQGFAAMLHQGMSDVQYVVEDMIADGDRVAYRWRLSGRHTGPFMGIPASGRQLAITGIDIFRLEQGKIVESWASADALGMLQQLGVIPTPGQAEG